MTEHGTWSSNLLHLHPPESRTSSWSKAWDIFQDISDWENLREKTPPFTPQLDNEEDAGYFDDFEDEEMMMKYKDVFARQEQNEVLLEKSGANKKTLGQNNFIGFNL